MHPHHKQEKTGEESLQLDHCMDISGTEEDFYDVFVS